MSGSFSYSLYKNTNKITVAHKYNIKYYRKSLIFKRNIESHSSHQIHHTKFGFCKVGSAVDTLYVEYFIKYVITAFNRFNMAECDVCVVEVSLDDNYCSSCGALLSSETQALKYYFKQGYEYKVIIDFLAKFHGISMCLSTLKNRLKRLGLSRKSVVFNEDEVRA